MEIKETETMKELHKIREEMYEEMRNMTSEERVRKIKHEAEVCKKEFGLKLPKRILVKK